MASKSSHNVKKRLPDNITYRPYEERDREAVKKLHDKLFPIKYDDNFYEMLTKPKCTTILAWTKDEGELLGVATARRKRPKSFFARFVRAWLGGVETGQYGYIMTFGVSADYRKLGLGRTMLELLLHQLREKGMEHVVLHVKKTNIAAIAFYQRQGFGITRLLRQYYLIDKHRHDALQMDWDIKDTSSKLKEGSLIGTDGSTDVIGVSGGESNVMLFVIVALIVSALIVILGAYLSSLPTPEHLANLPRRDPR